MDLLWIYHGSIMELLGNHHGTLEGIGCCELGSRVERRDCLGLGRVLPIEQERGGPERETRGWYWTRIGRRWGIPAGFFGGGGAVWVPGGGADFARGGEPPGRAKRGGQDFWKKLLRGKLHLIYSALRFPDTGGRTVISKPLTDNCSLYGWTTNSYPTEGL
jgi:hypothetical protein